MRRGCTSRPSILHHHEVHKVSNRTKSPALLLATILMLVYVYAFSMIENGGFAACFMADIACRRGNRAHLLQPHRHF